MFSEPRGGDPRWIDHEAWGVRGTPSYVCDFLVDALLEGRYVVPVTVNMGQRHEVLKHMYYSISIRGDLNKMRERDTNQPNQFTLTVDLLRCIAGDHIVDNDW